MVGARMSRALAQRSSMARDGGLKPVVVTVLLVIGVIVVVVLNREPPVMPPIEATPPLSADQLATVPDAQLFPLVVRDLRLAIVVGGKLSRWRELPEPARQVLALSWVHTDSGVGPRPPTTAFRGFRTLARETSPNAPTLDEVAAAYTAVGALEVAQVVRDAAKLGVDADTAEYARYDGRFASLSQDPRTVAKIRAYVRANAVTLAGAKLT